MTPLPRPILPADLRPFDRVRLTGMAYSPAGRRYDGLECVVSWTVQPGIKVWYDGDDEDGGKVWLMPEAIEALELLGREDDDGE